VPGTSYERYGLLGNPFRELASENVPDIELFHVNQRVDETLRVIAEEAFDKENKAVVAIAGIHGAGKTERLLLLAAEARSRKAFTVMFDVPEKVPFIVRDLAAAFQKTAGLGGFAQLFSAPKWFRDLGGLQRSKDPKYNAVQAGRAFAAALNANVPAILLLNDLHNLTAGPDLAAFGTLLQELSDQAKPGVLVVFGCYPAFLIALTKSRPALTSRINRSLILSGLSVEEAGLLIAKKLLAKRIVEDLEPLYPFERTAVAMLNEAAVGNPRRLLELADRALEYGVSHRAYRIDEEAVRAVIPPTPTEDRAPPSLQPAPASALAPPRSGPSTLGPERVGGTPSAASGPG
jgi:hypothetical protein